MAKFYDITFSCGHEERVWGIAREKIPYMKKYGLCSECYKKELEEKRAALRATLPETGIEWKGSEKQIKWGKDIMARLRKECQEQITRGEDEDFDVRLSWMKKNYRTEGYKCFMHELDTNPIFYDAKYMIEKWNDHSASGFIGKAYKSFKWEGCADSLTDAIKNAI